MDSNDFKELQIDRPRELKDKFLSSMQVLSSNYEKLLFCKWVVSDKLLQAVL